MKCERCSKRRKLEIVWTRFGDERLCAPCAKAVRANLITWELARTGCHWSSSQGEFTISTFKIGDKSGYGLWQDRRELGRFDTFAGAASAAVGGIPAVRA